MIPRVRFAPSPTGYLHVGGARTALFNWLYARRHGGTFILRIEDTDMERSSAEMITGILDGLRWLGIDWDEGPVVGGPHAPYLQSERLDRYRAAADRLVETGHAYHCYCTPERLKAERERAEQAGAAWKYDRACLALSPERRAELEAAGAPCATRFKVPAGVVGFDDQVHGRIEVDGATIEDFVILRSDRFPTYHLSVVVDDADMVMTHVVRGDDHISNTPKHILLFRALGAEPPIFAHVPLILGQDKKRLSKRHGATSVMEYERAGYLPEAMVNFLALLGWSPGGDRELMTRAELVEAFSLDGISGGNAVFNTEKLDWMNGQYIAQLPPARLVALLAPLFAAAGLTPAADAAWMARLVGLLQPRAKRLGDFVEQARPFLVEPVVYEADAEKKHLQTPVAAAHTASLLTVLAGVDPFDEATLEAAIRQAAVDRGVKAGELIHVARVAMTGRTTSPGIFEVLALLGRDRVVGRLRQLAGHLAARA
ncbi:MAG: glutamate--tRNA ligase [Vicinamibacterales bacterium]